MRQECVNKEDVYCEVLFDSLIGGNPTGRLIVENLLNHSFAETLTETYTSNARTAPTERTKYVDKKAQAPRENKTTPQQPTVSYSAILRNPEKKSDGPLDKKQNFAEMWNTLKQENEPATAAQQPKAQEPRPQQAPTDLSAMMANANLFSNQSPFNMAPKTLPAPPLEWLGNNQMKPKLEMPQPPPPQVFYQSPMPFNNGFPPFVSNQGKPFTPNNGPPFASNNNGQPYATNNNNGQPFFFAM